jgi:hypothetical protein
MMQSLLSYNEQQIRNIPIITTELQDAIHHWLMDLQVRGHIMSIVDLREIIVAWLSG